MRTEENILEEKLLEEKAAVEATLAKLEILRNMPESHRLAKEIHTLSCSMEDYDFRGMCTWSDEKWNDPLTSLSNENGFYLEKAEALLKEVDFMTAMKIANILCDM